MCIHIYVHIYICMCVCVYIYMCMCVYPTDSIFVVCLYMVSRLTVLCVPQIRGFVPGRAKGASQMKEGTRHRSD